MSKTQRHYYQMLIGVLLYLPMLVMALPSDANKPLLISSQSSKINYKQHTVTNIGNVIIRHGSSLLTADKVITYRNEKGQVIKMVGYGKPAHYKIKPSHKAPWLYTHANIITYSPPKQMVILRGDAFAERGKNAVHSSVITYNLNTQVIQTDAEKEKTHHSTHIIIDAGD